jgi:hypothetical protein
MSALFRTVSLSVGLALVACGDGDNGPGPSQPMVGFWQATKLEFVSVATPTVKIDAVALGGSLSIQLNASGTCTWTSAFPGEPAESFTGTWEGSLDVLTMRWSEGGYTQEYQFDWTISGSTLTLVGADASFDFNDDGTEEPAKLNVILVRQ